MPEARRKGPLAKVVWRLLGPEYADLPPGVSRSHIKISLTANELSVTDATEASSPSRLPDFASTETGPTKDWRHRPGHPVHQLTGLKLEPA